MVQKHQERFKMAKTKNAPKKETKKAPKKAPKKAAPKKTSGTA
jgi:hypothetical protein